MRYLSVCSGIEAATVAWHPLGWEAAAFSEIEAFPRAVLQHHYPATPLHGDFTTIGADEYGPIDLLVGGTPCQSFSVAGLRGGLADDRGNLALQFLKLADRTRARWVVWENVPGVLSSNGGRDFGSILGGLGELGYGWAYRVLDAQHFGVPQRRRRVFVVGHLGDWRRAAAVLFERHSLSGDTPPRREKGQDVAGVLTSRASGGGGGPGAGTDEAAAGYLQAVASTGNVAHCLNAGGMGRQDYETETLIAHLDLANMGNGGNIGVHDLDRPTITLDTSGNIGIAHSLRGEGFDASEDGTGRGTPLARNKVQAVAFGWQSSPQQSMNPSDISPALDKSKTPAVAFMEDGKGRCREREVADALVTGGGKPGSGYPAALLGSAVRSLTSRECEKLQGFPPGYTAVPYRGKLASDGPRYKALGNSMAVPVMRWIGARIQLVEAMPSAVEQAA